MSCFEALSSTGNETAKYSCSVISRQRYWRYSISATIFCQTMRAYTEKKVLNHAVAKFGNFTISLKCGRFAAELLVVSNFIDYLY
jgi:hypothetical protein